MPHLVHSAARPGPAVRCQPGKGIKTVRKGQKRRDPPSGTRGLYGLLDRITSAIEGARATRNSSKRLHLPGIAFSDQPAKPTSSITITAVSSNSGSQSSAGDDALWFFARHGSGTFDVYFEQVDCGSHKFTSNDCQSPSHSQTSQDILLLNGSVCLRFNMTYGGSVGAPTVTFSQFGLFPCN
ncbi:MAG: hypothetical protein WB783_06925 [Arenicellales bacterium]